MVDKWPVAKRASGHIERGSVRSRKVGHGKGQDVEDHLDNEYPH